MATNNRDYKLYLQNRATKSADDFNNLITQINKVVGVQLNDTQLEQLHDLFGRLEIRSEQADRSWERYVNFCQQNNYKIKDIEYLSSFAFHTTN